MGLTRGTFLGSCEILDRLGAGGMGEVYRGRDTRLGREVAVKALPDFFARDPLRMARFEREAQALAALNHPNLAIIHELKEVDGAKYLILELVEGETLAERIARGPLAFEEAVKLATQIADGAHAAHEKGIVHRDLKPSNIKITPEGRLKILDFGLAKIQAAANSSPSLSLAPTLSGAQTGVILGTAAYMSPEQARGKDVDRRADIWAFGCILYEMLTGRQAFPGGKTVSDTLASILVHEPDWQALPPPTPGRVRSLLERCLRKDETRRWGDLADARQELEEARSERETASLPAAPNTSRRHERLLVASAAFFFLTAAASVFLLLRKPAAAARPTFVEVIVPPKSPANSLAGAEISADGRKLAYLATVENKVTLWVRSLDGQAQPLTSTEGAGAEFFWSPDNQYIAYSTEGKLKKVLASGGPSEVIANLPAAGVLAGTWNADGIILLGSPTNPAGPLQRVKSGGGDLAAASELDKARKETAHAFPHFLPDGKHYFFVASSSDSQSPNATFVGLLDSKQRWPLAGIASEAVYSPTGHVLFMRDGSLMAQPFDAKNLQLTGDAFQIADGVAAPRAVGGAFSVSGDGRVAYLLTATPGGAAVGNSLLVWRERTGGVRGAAGPEGEYRGPELSWDGKFVAFSRGTPGNIWILDIERNLAEPLTNDPADDQNPRWSPDGKAVAFQSSRDGGENFYLRRTGVVGNDQLLLKDQATKTLSDWSHDGKYLAYTAEGDVWALPMNTDTKPAEIKPIRITQSQAVELTPRISPDGRWIAYVSNEPGQNEVYVQSFPNPGPRQKVSTNTGIQPRWSLDSKELFYYQQQDSGWMRVSIQPGTSGLTASAPEQLFPRFNAVVTTIYSVGPEQRFLLQQSPGSGAGGRGGRGAGLNFLNRIVVRLHWDSHGEKPQ